MPRSFLSLLLTVTTVLTAAAAAQPLPRAEAESREHRFGDVRQGTTVEHIFVLRNAGTAPLRITGLELAPPLRMTRMPAHVAPGAHVNVPIVLDTAGLSGEYEGQVTLRLNDPATPVVTFTIRGTVVPPVEFRPYAAFFVSGQRGSGGSGTIEILNHEAAPLRITRMDYPRDRFTVRLEEIEDGRRFRLTLELTPEAEAGTRQDVILLHTSRGIEPLRVVANTRLRDRVYAFPDVVDLGELPKAALEANPELAQRAAQTLMVYQAGGTAFGAEFSTDVPGLTITAEAGPKGDRWQATLTVAPSALAVGPVRGTVTIRTNDAEFPVVRVPVTGAVRP